MPNLIAVGQTVRVYVRRSAGKTGLLTLHLSRSRHSEKWPKMEILLNPCLLNAPAKMVPLGAQKQH